MALDNPRTTVPLYQDERYKQFADLLMADFEDVVTGLYQEIRLTHDYVGLKHFRDRVLAPNIARKLGDMCATILLNAMINQGKLHVAKIQLPDAEYEISVLEKTAPNGEAESSSISVPEVSA